MPEISKHLQLINTLCAKENLNIIERDLLLDQLKQLYEVYFLQSINNPQPTIVQEEIKIPLREEHQETLVLPNKIELTTNKETVVSTLVEAPHQESEPQLEIENETIEDTLMDTLKIANDTPLQNETEATINIENIQQNSNTIEDKTFDEIDHELERLNNKIHQNIDNLYSAKPTTEAILVKKNNPEIPKVDNNNNHQNSNTHLDIRKFIGINDKYNFIAELFSNRSGQYELFLKEINKQESLEAAMAFIEQSNVKQIFNWEEEGKSETVFYAILKQFFASK